MPFALDLSVLATFTLMWIPVVPTPGPNILMVAHVPITRTPVHLDYAIVGNMAGIVLLASLALIGWAAILETFLWLRVGVSIFGGLYLIGVGTRLIRRVRRSGSAGPVPMAAGATTGVATVLGWLFQREKMRAGYARYRGVLERATGSLFILFGGRLLWRAMVR